MLLTTTYAVPKWKIKTIAIKKEKLITQTKDIVKGNGR